MGRKRKIGQPTRLTARVQETICKYIRAGNYLVTAAAQAGVSYAAVNQWIQRGKGTSDRPTTQLYVDFVRAVDLAKAEAEIQLVVLLRREAIGRPAQYNEKGELTMPAREPDPQSAKWILERGYREHWGIGERTIVEHSGAVDVRPSSLAHLSDEALEKIERLMVEDATNATRPIRRVKDGTADGG